jgi:hypothetical protein
MKCAVRLHGDGSLMPGAGLPAKAELSRKLSPLARVSPPPGLGDGGAGDQQAFPKTLTFDADGPALGGFGRGGSGGAPALHQHRTHPVRNPVSTHLLS